MVRCLDCLYLEASQTYSVPDTVSVADDFKHWHLQNAFAFSFSAIVKLEQTVLLRLG